MIEFNEVTKTWFWVDKEKPKCHVCGEEIEEGYHCPISYRFWCLKCQENYYMKGRFTTCSGQMKDRNIEHQDINFIFRKAKT